MRRIVISVCSALIAIVAILVVVHQATSPPQVTASMVMEAPQTLDTAGQQTPSPPVAIQIAVYLIRTSAERAGALAVSTIRANIYTMNSEPVYGGAPTLTDRVQATARTTPAVRS